MRVHSNSGRGCHSRRRAADGGREAFTIIELVVVLVLMGIISAVVVPALWRAAATDTTGTLTAPVISLLRFAQLTAAQRNEVVTVMIDPTTNAYLAQTVDDGLTRATGTLVFPAQGRFVTDSARLRVVFNPVGGATADSIVVTDARNVVVVRIDPWTGVINVVRQ